MLRRGEGGEFKAKKGLDQKTKDRTEGQRVSVEWGGRGARPQNGMQSASLPLWAPIGLLCTLSLEQKPGWAEFPSRCFGQSLAQDKFLLEMQRNE